MSTPEQVLHASAVAIGGRGLLITGSPGSGKSALALDLISRGAALIADDQVRVSARGTEIVIDPVGAEGLIEARGIGILSLPHVAAIPLKLWADMDQSSPERLPQPGHRDLLGLQVPVIFGAGCAGLSAILWVLMSGARLMDPDAPIA